MESRGSDRGNPRSTAVLPWVLPRVTAASRGFPRQGPRVSMVHGASTASATVVPMAHAVVVSVATAVELAMAAHGSTTAIVTAIHGNRDCNTRLLLWQPLQLPRQSMTIRGNCHGIATDIVAEIATEIATAIHPDNPRQLPRHSTAFVAALQRNCHGSCQGNPRQLPRQSTATATAIHGNFNCNPRQSTAFRRKSTAVATAIQGYCHDKRRDATGSHGTWKACKCTGGKPW